MAQLIVGNVDHDLVRRAVEHGRSVEEEHHRILRAALYGESLLDRLRAMPDAGTDADFERLR